MSGSISLRIWPAGLLASLLLGGAAHAATAARIAVAIEVQPEGRASRIYLANPDGTGLQPLSPGVGRDWAPAFSPDGRYLAYQTTNDLGLDQILVQGLGDEKPRVLGVGSYPQWSRDGKRVLFSRRRLNEYGIYVARADGSENEESLKPIAKGQLGRWSPDEKRLAAVVPHIEKGVDRWQIQVMPAGSDQANFRHTLPEAFGQVLSLEWSPDGRSLLFTTSSPPRTELYALNLTSPETKRLPEGENALNAGFGSWSPDGREILFRVGPDRGNGPNGSSRLCVMKADGTGVRPIWTPSSQGQVIFGTAWYAPVRVAASNPAPPRPTTVKVKPLPEPAPAPVPAEPAPPAVGKVLAAPRKVHSAKLFKIARERSPVSVPLAQPGGNDFLASVNVLPWRTWTPRRQGVGITLELEDGALYRGNLIYSGGPWVTLQGRPKGGKVRLIDGKQLPAGSPSFRQGFKLTLKRDGKNLVVAVNDEEILMRPVLTADIKSLSLTLENFDPGLAPFRLGGIYFQEIVPGEVTAETGKGEPEGK